ncbi:MAG: type II toxin-antitoxin system HicB family antitoxin [Burkholderiales bacterium]|nr:type II toxin-antitoxin system HicB family antitoxin [Burkholderiales bacterium]
MLRSHAGSTRQPHQHHLQMAVDVDVSRLDVRKSQKPVRLNISLPEGLLHDIDEAARASGATRSGFPAKAARQAMAV